MSLGLFAHIAALTTLHAILTLIVGFGVEFFAYYELMAGAAEIEQLGFYDKFIVFNCHLGIIVCLIWLIFKKHENDKNGENC